MIFLIGNTVFLKIKPASHMTLRAIYLSRTVYTIQVLITTPWFLLVDIVLNKTNIF